MSFKQALEEEQGGVAVLNSPQSLFVAPPVQSSGEGEATMVFLFPCSDYSLIRSNVSRFVESTFGIPDLAAETPAQSHEDGTEAQKELNEVIA